MSIFMEDIKQGKALCYDYYRQPRLYKLFLELFHKKNIIYFSPLGSCYVYKGYMILKGNTYCFYAFDQLSREESKKMFEKSKENTWGD